jgi:hypothetical protein
MSTIDLVLGAIEFFGDLFEVIIRKTGDIFDMAKDRLFPRAQADDKREPHQRFNELATKVFSVPKSKIDEREERWRQRKKTKQL